MKLPRHFGLDAMRHLAPRLTLVLSQVEYNGGYKVTLMNESAILNLLNMCFFKEIYERPYPHSFFLSLFFLAFSFPPFSFELPFYFFFSCAPILPCLRAPLSAPPDKDKAGAAYFVTLFSIIFLKHLNYNVWAGQTNGGWM